MIKIIVKQKFQPGVTLLLTIIILTAMMAVTFSVASILVTEIRSSGDVQRTEQAYYGAQGQVEESLFAVKRNAPVTYSTQIGQSTLSASPKVNSTTPAIIVDRVPPLTDFNHANTYVFPASVAGDPSSGSGYNHVTLTYLPSSETNTSDPPYLHVYICQFDPKESYDPTSSIPHTYWSLPCTDPSVPVSTLALSYWALAGGTLTSYASYGQNVSIDQDLIPTMQQEIIIYNTSQTQSAYIKIQPYQDGVAKGLPYSSEQSVTTRASNSSVGRKINVIIPNP
jgi:hypothetical protein